MTKLKQFWQWYKKYMYDSYTGLKTIIIIIMLTWFGIDAVLLGNWDNWL